MANMNSPAGTWWNIGVNTLVLCAFLIISGALHAEGQDQTKPVTFSKDIASILQEKCQDCHRPGQIAPMSLLTYQDVRPWAKAIKTRVLQRSMPPWFLDKTVGESSISPTISPSATSRSPRSSSGLTPALRKATRRTCPHRKFGRMMTGGNSRRFLDGSRTWC